MAPGAAMRTRSVVKEFLKTLYDEFWEDDLSGLAAQCAYAFLFALFPFLIVMVSLVAYLPFAEDGTGLPPELAGQTPPQVREILDNRIEEVASGERSGTITLAIFVAIFSATSGAAALVTAINRAYDVTEKRSFFRRRLVALALILSGMVLIILPTMWGWFGGIASRFLEDYGLGAASILVDWARWPVIFIGAFAWLALLFRVAPEGTGKWTPASPGAFVAAIGFVIANRGLSFYLENAGDMSVTYGALGGFMVLLLWLYVASLVLLVAAEVNAILDGRKKKTPEIPGTSPQEPPLATTRPIRT